MLVKLDKHNMELDIRVGVLEKYSADKDIKSIHKKTEKLRKKMKKFMAQTVEPEMKELEDLIKEYNEKFIEE